MPDQYALSRDSARDCASSAARTASERMALSSATGEHKESVSSGTEGRVHDTGDKHQKLPGSRLMAVRLMSAYVMSSAVPSKRGRLCHHGPVTAGRRLSPVPPPCRNPQADQAAAMPHACRAQ